MEYRYGMGVIFILFAFVALIILYIMPTPMSDVDKEGFVDKIRCGVGIPSCDVPLRCINGYCKSDNPPTMPAVSDLPVRPDRYPYAPGYVAPAMPLPPALTE